MPIYGVPRWPTQRIRPSHAQVAATTALEPPQTISGLRFWFAADKITGLSNGAAVPQWDDASGNANHAAQSTGTARPTYQTGVLNGLPVVRFDGTDDRLQISNADALALTNNQDGVTMIAVANLTDATTSSNRYLVHFSTPATANTARLKYGQRFSTTNKWDISGRRLDADAQQDLLGGTTVTGVQLLSAVADYANSDATLYRNGAVEVSTTSWLTSGNTSATDSHALGVVLGGRFDGTEVWAGDIAEVLVYDSALNSTDRQTIEGYLTTKYALSGGQSATVAFASSSDLAVTPLLTQPAAVAFAQTSSLAVAPLVTHPVAVGIDSTSTLAVTPLVEHPATVGMASSSTLAVTPLVEHPATISLAQSSTLAVTASTLPIPTPGLWFRASDLAGLSDGAAINGNWSAAIGSSTANQATGANQPTKQTVNGRTCVRFDGTNDRLELDGDALTISQNVAGLTVFVRAQVNSTGGGTFGIAALSVGTGTGLRVAIRRQASVWQAGGRRLDADGFASTGTQAADNVPRTLAAIYDYTNSDLFLFVDGVAAGSNTTFQAAGSTSNTASQTARLGTQSDDVNFAAMDLYEVIVYQRALTTTERQQVENYLNVPVVVMASSSTLAVAPLVTHPASVALAQSSTLDVTPLVTHPATVTFGSTSTLGVVLAGEQTATVTLAQSSSLAVTPLVTHPAAVALAQSSTLAVTALVTELAAVALAQSSTLAVAPLLTHPATMTLAQSSTLAVAPLVTHPYAVTLAQSSSLAVSGFQTIPSTVAFASTSTLGVTVQGQQAAAVAFAQSSTLTVAALVIHPYAVTFGQTSTLNITATVTRIAAVTFASNSTLQVSGTLLVAAVVAFVSTGTLNITAVAEPPSDYQGGFWDAGDSTTRWAVGTSEPRWKVGAGGSRWGIGG